MVRYINVKLTAQISDIGKLLQKEFCNHKNKNKTIQTKAFKNMVNTRQSNNKNEQKVAKVTPTKQKQQKKARRTNKVKAVKKKISIKQKVIMPKKIYNVNLPPVKMSAKVQPGKNLKFKKLKTKKKLMNANQRYMLTMKSEICAFNNVVVMFPLRQDGSPGFVYNVHQAVMKEPETKHSLMKEDKLDCSYLKYPYL